MFLVVVLTINALKNYYFQFWQKSNVEILRKNKNLTFSIYKIPNYDTVQL